MHNKLANQQAVYLLTDLNVKKLLFKLNSLNYELLDEITKTFAILMDYDEWNQCLTG